MIGEDKKEPTQASDNPFDQEGNVDVDGPEPQEEVPMVDAKKEKLSSRENLLNFLTENKERNKQGLK